MNRGQFRGRRIDNGELIFGNMLSIGEDIYIIDRKYLTKESKSLNEIFKHIHKIIPATLGEFSGLLDSNLQKIYENDSIEIFENDFHDGSPIFKIVYDENLKQWSANQRNGYSTPLVNIYTNESTIIETSFNRLKV